MDSLKFPLSRFNLATAAIAGLASAYELSKRSYNVARSEPPFPTSTETMPIVMRRPATKIAGKRRRFSTFRRSYRRFGVYRSLRRSTGPGVHVAISAGTSGSYSVAPQLSFVATSDLTGAYSLYRIKKVVWTCWPRIDPANSSLANNHQFQVAAACDCEGPRAAPTTINDITVLPNHYIKPLVAGQKFTYTFYPKAVNSISTGAGVSSVGSYRTNPWIKLDATGITIPHQQLIAWVQTAGSATTVNFDGYLTYYFDVRA